MSWEPRFFSYLPAAPDMMSAPLAVRQAMRSCHVDDSRLLILGFLRSGLLRSYAARASMTWQPLSELGGKLQFNSVEKRIEGGACLSGGGRKIVTGLSEISTKFWRYGHVGEERQWHGDLNFPLGGANWSDWKRGEFASVDEHHDSDIEVEDGDMMISFTRVFGVTFALPDFEALFPHELEPEKRPLYEGRPEKYDWLSAFAAISGRQLKHEFLPDLYAKGAQADLAEALAQWFVGSNLDEPGATSLKEKASVLLRHWRTEDSK